MKNNLNETKLSVKEFVVYIQSLSLDELVEFLNQMILVWKVKNENN